MEENREYKYWRNILLHHTKEKEGTRKWRRYWEKKVYVVLEKISDLPIYIIKPIEGQLNSAKGVLQKQHYELEVSEYRHIT